MDGEISHLCGFGFVLDALAQSLRELDEKGRSAAPGAAPEFPKVLSDYLDVQQRRAYELQDMLERLGADDELPACLGIAACAADELNVALDANSICFARMRSQANN